MTEIKITLVVRCWHHIPLQANDKQYYNYINVSINVSTVRTNEYKKTAFLPAQLSNAPQHTTPDAIMIVVPIPVQYSRKKTTK